MSDNLWLGLLTEGLAANRPTAPTVDGAGNFVYYFSTDTGALDVYTGAAWVSLATHTGVATASLPTPSASIKGNRAFTSDGAATPVFGAVATGSGSLFLPVFCDGAAWRNG